MINLRESKDYSTIPDEDFKSSLDLIYPSKRINRKILLELEKRNIRNDARILKYLLELKKMKIEYWSIERLLITLYDQDLPSTKIINPPYVKELIETHKKFKLSKVVSSIKRRILTEHFENFINTLEHITFTLNLSDEQTKENVINANLGFIFKFLDLTDKIKSKERKRGLINFRNGKFHFKETWLLALNNKLLVDQILILIFFNIKNMKDLRIQVLKNSLEKRLFTKYKETYKIISNIKKRYKNEQEEISLPESNFKEDPRIYSFVVSKAEKTNYAKSLEWFKNRTEYK